LLIKKSSCNCGDFFCPISKQGFFTESYFITKNFSLSRQNNTMKCLDAIIQSRKNIQKKSGYFKSKFGVFLISGVGINVGEVNNWRNWRIEKRPCYDRRYNEQDRTHPQYLYRTRPPLYCFKRICGCKPFKGMANRKFGLIDLNGKNEKI
jgi:hypothetical protein